MTVVDLSRARWCKSSRSLPREANCVEVAFVDRAVAARDSKDPEGGVLVFPSARWSSFVDGLRGGRFR